MDELLRQAISILHGMWHRRWFGLVTIWVIGIAGVVYVMRLPDIYEASARIYVDTQSVLKPLMQGLAVQPNVDQQVMILSRTLISRPNVEKLIRMADLDLGIKSKSDQDGMVDYLMGALKIAGTGGDNLYYLSYRDGNPDQAKRLVQSLVSIFVESNLGDKRKDSDSAKRFIEAQIKVYERKLEEAENRVKEFKIRQLTSNNAGGGDYFTRMSQMTALLNQARLEYREAEQSRDSLKRELTGEEPVFLPDTGPANASSVSVPEIDGRIETVRRNLDGLLQRYTDQHPDVINARRFIQELEDQKVQMLAARRKAAPSVPQVSVQNNPVYQQLRISLAEAEANVSRLRTRVAEYEARYAQLKGSAGLVPEMEAEYAALNRDYEINKRNYEGFVSRRESAEISGEMEAVSGADFRLIDPPRVAPRPVAPNRTALLLGVLFTSLAGGLFVTFAISQVWPTFFDIRALRDRIGLPVLGTVSMIMNDGQKRRERRGLIGFLSALLAFLGSYGTGLLLLLLLSARAA